jgi:ATP-dependent DNA helicase Q1
VVEDRGFTLVISPLLSLIEDQVASLSALGVAVAALTSATPPAEASATTAALDDARSPLRLLYVTPEKVIKSKRFFAKLEKAYKAGVLRRIAVDEAHCISQWGADFRSDYVKLHVLKEQVRPAPCAVSALVADARCRHCSSPRRRCWR